MRISNDHDISLMLAVWLVSDNYDYIDKENYISATTLMKPLRQIVLPSRIPPAQRTSDVVDYIARSLGSSVHDSVEKAWTTNHDKAMRLLGYPADVIDRIRINPTPEELRASNSIIPLYFEQRAFREIDVDGVTYTIGGKFDAVTEGIVQDLKSTSTFAWEKGTKDEDYAQQGSIYRWLNPDKITADHIRINFLFTDWSKMHLSRPNYPRKRVEYKDIPLWSVAKTEEWIRGKLRLVAQYINKPESEIPECSDEELWRSSPQYKYFADPAKTAGRSTRKFDDMIEARKFMAEKGGKGVIITKPGEVKACGYCAGYDACTQKDQYFAEAAE